MYRPNELIATHEEQRQLKNHISRHNNAIKIDFDLSDENLTLLEAMYAPCKIHTTPGRLPPAHPIAAAQQRIAYSAAYRWATTRLAEGLIEIGPNPSNFAKIATEKNYATTHGCTKPDGRDESRYMTAAWSQNLRTCRDVNYRNDVEKLRSSLTTNKFCVNGFGNCMVQAVNAISVHSLYDITLSELALGFYNHGTEQLRAWMHLPYEMLKVDNWSNKTHQYFFSCHTNAGRKTVRFGFHNDPSFMYEHDYATWTAYMTTSCFNTPYGFALLIERVAQHGTQVELKISRVSIKTSIVHTIPSGLSNIIGIPDLTDLAKKNFCSHARSKYFYTDASKVAKLTEFLLARDNKGFSLNTCLAYARSLKSQVKVGQVIYEESWDITREFTDICISIFIMCEFNRRCESEVLYRSFFHMDKAAERRSFLTKFFQGIREKILPVHIHELKEKIISSDNGILTDSDKSNNHFCKMTFQFFDDLSYTGETNQYTVITPKTVPILEPEITMPYNAPKIPHQTRGDTPAWISEMRFDTGEPVTFDYDWKSVDHQQMFVDAIQLSLLTSTEPGLQKVFTAAAAAVSSGNANDPNWNNTLLVTGPPGSGKSSHLRKYLFPTLAQNGQNALYITPTRALRDEMRIKITDKKVVAHTLHTAMAHATTTHPNYIIIDECFTFPSAVLAWFTSLTHQPRVILLGDQAQIPHIDFDGCWFEDVKFTEIAPYLLQHRFTISHRCPADVTALPIMQYNYPGVTSASNVDSSISYIIDKPADYHKEGYQHLSFTQAGKATYLALGYNSCTVHEAQGQTFDNVILHFNTTPQDAGLVRDSPNHVIVAITRHTDKLMICDETNSTLVTVLNDDTKVSIPLAKSDIDIQAIPDKDERTITCLTERIHNERVPYATTPVTLVAASNVLQNAFPMQPLKEYQAILDKAIPEIHAKATLRPNALGKDEQFEIKKHTYHSFPEPQRVKVTRSTDQRMSLISMAKRQGAKTKNLSNKKCHSEATRLFKLVRQEFDFVLNDDDLRLCYYDAVKKFTSRGHDLTDLLNITDWNDQSARLVKNFLKSQQKPSTTSDPLVKAKAGQGISAWSKTLNFQITIWTRYLESVMTKQSKGKVLIATGFTDEQMLALLEEKHVTGTQLFENDWTEFDSSQNNLTHAILGLALKQIGCPIAIIAQFLEQLTSRRVADEFLTIEAEGKKDSGAPHTLIDNCLFNLAIHLDILSDFSFLAIKGDDVLAGGSFLSFSKKKMEDYYSQCGYKFKPSKSSSCGFVSFIINDQGSAYDFPRLASKVLSRNYLDIDDYLNYQEALRVTLAPVTLDVGINMVKVNALHHNLNYRTQVNDSDMDMLLSFLHRFSNGKIPFSETISKESSTLFCEPKIDLSPRYQIPHLRGSLPKVAKRFTNAAIATVLNVMD